jgi:hypothetical protein
MADRAGLAAIKARLEHVERPASVFAHAVPQAMYAADVAALLGEVERLSYALEGVVQHCADPAHGYRTAQEALDACDQEARAALAKGGE